MSKYRINVRFDLDKQKEAKAAQYLQSLDKSRNAFMVTAILNEIRLTLCDFRSRQSIGSVLCG